MSYRESHRILAQELRWDRIDAGLSADPSHRERKLKTMFACPQCEKTFHQGWQLRIHVWLNVCGGGLDGVG